MNKTTNQGFAIFFTLLIFCSGALIAQERDTISMLPSKTHDVYYSLKHGENSQVIRDNWDIQFGTKAMDVSIRTNGAIGVELYTYPNSDISGWESLDTTGLHMWPVLYNDATNWENGAFNVNATGHPDYGWGVYNDVTHNITGDSLYVVLLPDGKIKKLWIIMKDPHTGINKYTFRHANLDGSDDTEVSIACDTYTSKNFIGYSFGENAIVDREPESTTWDLLFTKYKIFYGGIMWYGVTGLLQNFDVQVASYPETDTSFVDFNINDLDSTNISTIGNNWHTMEGGHPPTFKVTDSLVYIISDREKSIWKFVFEYYESSLGEIGFKKQLLEDHTGISETQNRSTNGNLAIQPNPAKGDEANILFTADDNGEALLSIYNLVGTKMYDRKITYQNGLNNFSVDISDLPTGAYILMLNSGNVTLKNKLIVQ